MTGARELTLALGGHWHGRYGAAPCPVCQPDRRRDQNALTLDPGTVVRGSSRKEVWRVIRSGGAS